MNKSDHRPNPTQNNREAEQNTNECADSAPNTGKFISHFFDLARANGEEPEQEVLNSTQGHLIALQCRPPRLEWALVDTLGRTGPEFGSHAGQLGTGHGARVVHMNGHPAPSGEGVRRSNHGLKFRIAEMLGSD
jgi:hypothetical protein